VVLTALVCELGDVIEQVVWGVDREMNCAAVQVVHYGKIRINVRSVNKRFTSVHS
jgi:hypothetical protein